MSHNLQTTENDKGYWELNACCDCGDVLCECMVEHVINLSFEIEDKCKVAAAWKATAKKYRDGFHRLEESHRLLLEDHARVKKEKGKLAQDLGAFAKGRDDARAWAKVWKQAAKQYRGLYWTHDAYARRLEGILMKQEAKIKRLTP